MKQDNDNVETFLTALMFIGILCALTLLAFIFSVGL